MPLTDDERLELQERIMVAEAKLKERQSFWETPRNLAIIIGAAAALAGVLGFGIGRSGQTINVHLDGPLVAPAPAQK
jgi:undecaprenyl pyrophosphate phosphatase UppP